MARNITVTFNDGTSHVYQNAPDDLTPDMVSARAQQEFGKAVTSLDGGRPAASTSLALQPSVRTDAGIPGPRQDLTMGQQVYQAARPYVAPLVEAGGAIGGGLLGAGAGTFGAGPVGTAAGGVAGAGLGYGIAKEGLEAADVAMGMKAPRQGAAQVVEPVRNILEGSTFEAGGKVLGQALGYVGGKIADLRQIPLQKASKIVKDALGPDLEQVNNALRAAQGKGVSAAQATADINSPTFQALIERATARDPRFLRALEKTQGEESVNALAKLAGGSTAAATRGTSEMAKNNLNTITTPMREASLGRANLGKSVASEAANREAHDLATMIGSGGELDAARFASQAKGAEKALRSVGIKPLEGGSLADKIAAIPQNPAFAENDLIEGAATRVAEGIRKWTGSNGVIDADALEAIRKNAVDAAIAKLRPGADATTQRNAAASVMSNIKPLIDDAIEAAGGTGWRDYLKAHSQGMQKIAEKKLSGEALNLWKTNKDEFVRLVQNESPEAVEKILGPGRYNIATELADSTMGVLQDQAKKRLTEMAIKEQVSGGQEALKALLLDNMSKLRVPSYLSAVAATTNKALNILENKIGKKTMETLTEALKTPEGAADLLATLPGSERNRVAKLISDPSMLSTTFAKDSTIGVGAAKRAEQAAEAIRRGSVAAGVNALAPDRNDDATYNQPARIILNNMAPGRP